ASRNKHFHKSIVAGTKDAAYNGAYSLPCTLIAAAYPAYASACYHGRAREFVDSQNGSNEEHMMLDFTLGKDVGLGAFGNSGKSTISAGVRFAQFHTDSSLTLGADPHYNIYASLFSKYHEVWEFDSQEVRTFHGVGPEVRWDGNTALWGDAQDGQVT